MMKNKVFPLLLAIAINSGQALAASKTVTLKVGNMTCAVCPITVKKALENISGVLQVKIDYSNKTVIVEFDDAIATTDQLTESTRDAGYPSTVEGDRK